MLTPNITHRKEAIEVGFSPRILLQNVLPFGFPIKSDYPGFLVKHDVVVRFFVAVTKRPDKYN